MTPLSAHIFCIFCQLLSIPISWKKTALHLQLDCIAIPGIVTQYPDKLLKLRGYIKHSFRSQELHASPWRNSYYDLYTICGNIRYFWLVSEESWLCANLDERDEVVQCASSALVGRAYSALENSMLAFFEERNLEFVTSVTGRMLG